MTKPPIDSFRGEYEFLSNLHPCTVVLDGLEYPSVEHAYQAAKSTDPEFRRKVRKAPVKMAMRWGKKTKCRSDWDRIKRGVMERLLRQKFNDPELWVLLQSTGERALVEGNTWGDTYWGVCKGVGRNHLGRLLMKIRSEPVALGD